MPLNGLMALVEALTGLMWGFHAHMLVVFALPLAHGAWRFVLFHALAGPVLAGQLTDTPNEVPAVRCLFSIGIILIALSPALRLRFTPQPHPR